MQDKVKLGPTSQIGYGVTLTALAAAVVAYANGDRSVENATVIGLGLVAGVSYVVTAVGRYAQAHAQVKAGAHERIAVVHADADVKRTKIEHGILDAPEMLAADFPEPEPEEPSWLHDKAMEPQHSDPGEGYEDPQPSGTWDQDQAKIAAWHDPPPHDLVDEPEDSGSDQVPEHELRDLHDGGRC